MRIRTRRIRPHHKKVKPILWVKVGVKNMTSVEVDRYVVKIMERMDFDDLRKDGYIPFLTPIREQDNVTMEIL
jgi:hypothetical protein